MKNKQKIKKSKIMIEVIDKINIIKVDVTFMSNLLSAWDIKEMNLSPNDMFVMSRVCNSINVQLNECENLVNSIKKKAKKLT